MAKVIFFTNMALDNAQRLVAVASDDYDVEIHPMGADLEQKSSLVQEADFLILFPGVLEDEVIRAAKKLKLIQLVSAGFDRVNVELCRHLGIPVANNGGANSIDVAEHAVMLMLAYYRRLRAMDSAVRNDAWKSLDSGSTTYTIDGKTIGIIGLGNIGRQTARLLRPFGAELVYYDPYPVSESVEQELQVRRATLDELLGASDIATLHVPLNEQTHHLIGAKELQMMKRSAVLVNTCRGPVVDEKALIDALHAGEIAGAALDVLDKEPPDAGNPLFQMDNVLLTPHTAGVTYDTWPRRGKFIFANLDRIRSGEEALAVVN